MIELHKCYPSQFENLLIPALKSEEERLICKAVLRNDEDEIHSILQGVQAQLSTPMMKKAKEEESKTSSSYNPPSNQNTSN